MSISAFCHFKPWELGWRKCRTVRAHIASCVAAGCGRHGIPPPACKNPTSQLYIAGRDSWQRMLHWRTNSEVRRSSPFSRFDTVLVSAVAGLVTTLVCDTGLPIPSLALKLLRIIARGVCNRSTSTNFGVSRTFRSRLIGQHLSDAPCGIATLNFDLGGHGACWWYSVGIPSIYQVWSLQAFPFGRYDAFPISELVDVVTFDLWPWNWCALYCRWGGQHLLAILVFLEHDLWANTCQADDVTLRLWPLRSWRMSVMQVFVLHQCTKFEVRRPLRSEDIAHLLC